MNTFEASLLTKREGITFTRFKDSALKLVSRQHFRY